MIQPPADDFAPPEPAQEQRVRIRMPDTPATVTYILLGVTIFIYVLQSLSSWVIGDSLYGIDYVTLFGARISDAIEAGQIWRLITPVFLHGSLGHIFFNMYALFSIGTLLEQHFGHGRFALLYFLGAFAGNVFSYLFTEGYSVGASTAVFGLIAAEAVFFYHNREIFGAYAKKAIGNAFFVIAINLFLGLAPNIDTWGHIGGLIGGAIFAWFASPQWLLVSTPGDFSLYDQRAIREVRLGALLVILLFGGLTVWGLVF